MRNNFADEITKLAEADRRVVLLSGDIGNKLGDVEFSKFAHMLNGHGEEVRDPSEIGPALKRARAAIARTGRCAVVNVWIDPNEYAPGTKNQTMYK